MIFSILVASWVFVVVAGIHFLESGVAPLSEYVDALKTAFAMVCAALAWLGVEDRLSNGPKRWIGRALSTDTRVCITATGCFALGIVLWSFTELGRDRVAFECRATSVWVDGRAFENACGRNFQIRSAAMIEWRAPSSGLWLRSSLQDLLQSSAQTMLGPFPVAVLRDRSWNVSGIDRAWTRSDASKPDELSATVTLATGPALSGAWVLTLRPTRSEVIPVRLQIIDDDGKGSCASSAADSVDLLGGDCELGNALERRVLVTIRYDKLLDGMLVSSTARLEPRSRSASAAEVAE